MTTFANQVRARPGLLTGTVVLVCTVPALLGQACSTGAPERPPWERDGGRAADARAPEARPDGGAPTFRPVEAQVELGESLMTLTIGGTSVDPGGKARAWLEGDLDQDGDADALVVVERGPPATLSIVTYQREGTALPAAGTAPLAASLGEGCVLEDLRVRLVAPGVVTTSSRTRCPGRLETSVALVEAGMPPRVRETARLEGASGGPAHLDLTSADRDGDARLDAVVSIGVDGATAELVYLDRAAGLSIDPATPERSLGALVPGRRTANAVGRARALVSLRTLLCTGALGDTRLSIAGAPSHECGSSRALGRAITTLVGALLDNGRVPEASEALGLLRMEGVALGEEARAGLEHSVQERTTLTFEATHEVGPAAVPAARPPLRHPLRFLDDDRIEVASREPFVYFVSSRESSPSDRYEDRVLSPDGRTVVWDLDRSCRGHRALLCPTDGCPGGLPAGTVVVARDGLGADTPGCGDPQVPAPSAPPRPDLAILGWRAPGGLIVLDGPRLREIPVSDEGQSRGPARDLSPPTELPPGAPLGAGGRRQAVGGTHGLWIRDGEGWCLLPETRVGGPWSEAQAIAMSPDGDTVAGIRHGHLEIVRLRRPEVPVPAGP